MTEGKGHRFMDSSSEANASAGTARVFRFAIAGIPAPAIAFLVLTAAISLVLSHYSLLWYDEFLVLWTDSVSSIGQLAHIQLACPISLHPFGYDPIVFASIRLFGAGPFAIRLPSLFGYLLMQVCLYVFVRRVAPERTAVFALAFPALNTTLIYASEGRPYALMLGWFALAMVSWQTAVRRESGRILALVLLTAAVVMALNTHYFGVLLLVPLCGAELYRSLQRRRLDIPVIASIGAGMAGILFTLPFMKAVHVFHDHYYRSDGARPSEIAKTYLSILPGYGFTHRHALIAVLFLAIVALSVLWGCIRQLRRRTISLPNAEAVFLILLAGLPFFEYLLTFVLATSLEPRFVHGVLVGVSPLVAIAFIPLLRREIAGRIVLLALFFTIGFFGFMHIRAFRNDGRTTMSGLQLAPEVKAALMASPTKLLYVAATYEFSRASYYEPDLEVRSHLALVYSEEQELRWHHGDTGALTGLHMRSFTGFHILPFELLAKQPGDNLVLVFNAREHPDDWTEETLTAGHFSLRRLGPFAGGEVTAVRFLP